MLPYRLLCFILVLFFINYGDSYISPANNGYHLVLADKYSQILDEYNAGTGELFKRFNNAFLVNPRDVKGYNNTLYVTGNHYAISMYDQTTLEYKGSFLNFTIATQTLRFFNNNTKLGVVLYDEQAEQSSLNIYEFPSKILNGTIACTLQCFDLIENRINGKLLVAHSKGVDQYNFNAGSWSLEGRYLNLTGTQTRGMLQWAGNQLFVGVSTSNVIARYNAGPVTAVSAGNFATRPPALGTNWVLMGFDFYPNSTTQIAAVGYDYYSYQGYLYRFSAATWTIIATSDLSQNAMIGIPENVYFDDTGKLLVSDYSWITRWNATNGTFLGQIMHQLGIMDIQGIAVNPLDPQYTYIATGNRVIRFDRLSSQPVDVFIPRVLASEPDGYSIAARMQWHNSNLWVAAYQYIVGFNASGLKIIQLELPGEKIVSDFKIHPNGLLYATAWDYAELYECDLTAASVTLRLTGTRKYSKIAFSPDGAIMYLCADTYCTGVKAYSTANWTVIGASNTSLVPEAVDLEVGPDGNVYLQTDLGVYVLDGTTLVGIGSMTQPMGANNYRGFTEPGDITFASAYPNSPSPTPSCTPSTTPTSSVTPSISASPSVTPSSSVSSSVTPSRTPTPSSTPSPTASVTPTKTPSASPTPSVTPSSSVTPSITPSNSVTPTSSPSYIPRDDNNIKSAAVGAGVGAAGGVLLCGALVGFFVYRRQAKKKRDPEDVPMDLVPGASQEEAVQNMFNKFWEINFDDLEIGSEVGRGAFGAVFKGEWRNSHCVVKQLQVKQDSQDSVAAFLKEANTVKMLRNHRNVCTIFGVCTNPEKPICIVMEYCNGGNLQSALIHKKIIPTLPNLIRIFKDITSGMSHVHLEGIVHCDLACRNVLVSFEGNGEFAIKISDFGLARVMPPEGVVQMTDDDMFPIRWSAPELLRDKTLSRACDIWSFGVVMWEIIAGMTPYWNLDNLQVIDYVCNKQSVLEEPTRIAAGNLPKTLYSIMKNCWSQPDQRPAFEYLNREFKELEKDLQPRDSEVIPDTNYQDQLEDENDNTKYDTATRSKYSRYSKITTTPTSSNSNGSEDTGANVAYGNKFTPTNSE